MSRGPADTVSRDSTVRREYVLVLLVYAAAAAALLAAVSQDWVEITRSEAQAPLFVSGLDGRELSPLAGAAGRASDWTARLGQRIFEGCRSQRGFDGSR
jgi:hypothetical protein